MSKNFNMRYVIFVSIFFALCMPVGAQANGDTLEVSGWIPYWRDSEGMKDAKKHLSQIDMVYPFAFTVTSGGELRDQAGLDEKDWKSFVKTAQKKDVLVVPTVMWSDGVSMQAILTTTETRRAHVKEIATMVRKGRYDGVDIDYEGKTQATKNGFSQFLIELKEALGKKMLVCTIEPRTPPDSLYKEVPETMKYVNDYEVIGEYCDQVNIMAYDQQRADLKLNLERKGQPYIPLSDIDWVRKVVDLTVKSIPKEKVVLGVPTYGHHYAISVAPDWYRDYWKLGAMNVPDMLDVAKEHKVTPSRNASGEMSFSYLPESSTVKFKSSLKIPKNTTKGNLVAAKALAYANENNKELIINVGWYSDAGAIQQKIELAEEFNLRGIALFKIDGEEDQKLWKYLK